LDEEELQREMDSLQAQRRVRVSALHKPFFKKTKDAAYARRNQP
jgi:hypothetical protein